MGWHVSESLHTGLILPAFKRAVAICQPPPGRLVHADRGSQYTRDAFTQLLDRTQAIASRSWPGNPTDNALAASGWNTLKTELLPRGACFTDLEEARFELAEYPDHDYNTQRLHSALGYCSQLSHCLARMNADRILLTDEMWKELSPLLPGQGNGRGVVAKNTRGFVEAVLWLGRTGAAWRDLPPHLGQWAPGVRALHPLA